MTGFTIELMGGPRDGGVIECEQREHPFTDQFLEVLIEGTWLYRSDGPCDLLETVIYVYYVGRDIAPTQSEMTAVICE